MIFKYRILGAACRLYKGHTECYPMLIRMALFLSALLVTPSAFSADISGVWKHAKEPIWIEIRLQESVGIVVRNDNFPERVGREILNQVNLSKSKPGLWHGRLYIEKLAEYKSVEIFLPTAERMTLTGKVGFISRTVEWRRDDQ